MLLKLQPVVLLALVAREASSLSLGQFNVSRSTQLLTDHSRQDPFASTSQPRDVVISIFRPASNTCTTYAPTPYMPLKTAQFEDATLGTAYGLPAGTITNLTLDLATCNTTAADPTDRTTTILFSPALGTPRHFYTLLAAALAAATRATVITIDHPHDASVVEYPNGTLVTGVDISSDAQILLAVATRAQDMRFVLDTFIPPACGALAIAIGHSLGGAAALVAAAQDARIASAVNIDGSVFFSSSSSSSNASVSVSVDSQTRTLFLAHEGKDLTTDATDFNGLIGPLYRLRDAIHLNMSLPYKTFYMGQIDLATPNNKDSTTAKKQQELRPELAEIRKKQQANNGSRNTVFEQIRSDGQPTRQGSDVPPHDRTCAICTDAIAPRSTVARICPTSSKHVTHWLCMLRWLSTWSSALGTYHRTCPSCRAVLFRLRTLTVPHALETGPGALRAARREVDGLRARISEAWDDALEAAQRLVPATDELAFVSGLGVGAENETDEALDAAAPLRHAMDGHLRFALVTGLLANTAQVEIMRGGAYMTEDLRQLRGLLDFAVTLRENLGLPRMPDDAGVTVDSDDEYDESDVDDELPQPDDGEDADGWMSPRSDYEVPVYSDPEMDRDTSQDSGDEDEDMNSEYEQMSQDSEDEDEDM
ncbi:putative paf acetylhydrolase family protein [Diplodia seriata]|uniref:Putative paf acetylhydrolase family protein n=1 Tax=Diplodia seriata TaxID=420778 RepID=A0A0G2DST1_9PEZI|nr:putative paf acetylhydrolase family protein [Diplodia seriata]